MNYSVEQDIDPIPDDDPLPNISLPVFLKLEVDGYELFPGKDKSGLNHSFVPGVTVIAGVNGLGKTTLLNVMLRLLLGPRNPAKASSFEIGAKSKLVAWPQARRFFPSRVTDDAANAAAYAEVAIGDNVLRIRRRLRDLQITYLADKSGELDATETAYEQLVLAACRVASDYDFDFLVRYLVFFLEQRTPLFWSERGQIEIFRILLCDADLATSLKELRDRRQALDSAYRNKHWQFSPREKKFLAKVAAKGATAAVGAQIEALRTSCDSLDSRNTELIRLISESSDERKELRNRLVLAKVELADAKRAHEAHHQRYVATTLPGTNEAARHLFSTLISRSGCSVCGSSSERGYIRLHQMLAHGDCPVCESPSSEQLQSAPQVTSDDSALRAALENIERVQNSIDGMQSGEKELEAKVRELVAEQSSVNKALRDRRAELERLKGTLPPTPAELQAEQNQLDLERDELKSILAEIEKLELDYDVKVEHVNAKVHHVSAKVCARFQEYAKSFMEEDCQLELAKYKEKVGNLKETEYPCFQVRMTSATSPKLALARTQFEDVSESQREFIDLAFRMALIAAVTDEGSRSMLVIETPEASLDALFIDQAGDLLRRYARGDDSDGNVVIVSSNLARQNMISALLGLTDEEAATWPHADAVKSRVINLLEECQPNAALRNHRQKYEQEFHKATRGLLKTL